MTNRVWFVTGASKGLGLVLVRELLACGYRVAATSRNVRELVARVSEASSQFLPLQVELTDETSVVAAVSKTKAHFGALDVVVNNAGYGQMGTVEEVTDAEARRNYDVNVFGTLNVLRAVLPELRSQRSGHVFNISSIGGLVGGFSGWGVYCSTKFAIAGITEALHADVAPFDVKVTLVYPGYFRTDFLAADSVSRPSHPIEAYAAARASETKHIDEINGSQPGDPAKAARAMIDVFERPVAPLHLLLGSDAVSMAEAKLSQVRGELDELRSISVSTDF
jgi:NAD(P)-dependent dehydrogenase (short-subunit alcohol dehydrogenase family)